jgi:hypothetical protein
VESGQSVFVQLENLEATLMSTHSADERDAVNEKLRQILARLQKQDTGQADAVEHDDLQTATDDEIFSILDSEFQAP